jgi:hypothetical protein
MGGGGSSCPVGSNASSKAGDAAGAIRRPPDVAAQRARLAKELRRWCRGTLGLCVRLPAAPGVLGDSGCPVYSRPVP